MLLPSRRRPAVGLGRHPPESIELREPKMPGGVCDNALRIGIRLEDGRGDPASICYLLSLGARWYWPPANFM